MKFAICNELFEGWSFDRVVQSVASIGYTGVEIAPFTLAPLATDVTSEQRSLLRRQANDAGVEILGLHWLFAKTEGFQVTSADAEVRRRSAAYLDELIHLCADLGGDILVFGSPAARKIPAGKSRAEAMDYAADTLRQAAPVLAERNVRLCLEPLGPAETEFLNTASEAIELADAVGSPQVQLHLDVKAMSTEQSSIPELLHRHAARLGHFHANDPNLRGPGMGDTKFEPIFGALKAIGYTGWVSVEVFDFKPDPETIARESLAYMRRCMEEC